MFISPPKIHIMHIRNRRHHQDSLNIIVNIQAKENYCSHCYVQPFRIFIFLPYSPSEKVYVLRRSCQRKYGEFMPFFFTTYLYSLRFVSIFCMILNEPIYKSVFPFILLCVINDDMVRYAAGDAAFVVVLTTRAVLLVVRERIYNIFRWGLIYYCTF